MDLLPRCASGFPDGTSALAAIGTHGTDRGSPSGYFQCLIHSTRFFRNMLPGYLPEIITRYARRRELMNPASTALACSADPGYSPARAHGCFLRRVVPMTKSLWSIALVATLGVGTAGTIYLRHSSEAPTCCVTSERPVPAPMTPAQTPTSATVAQPSAAQPLPVIRDDVDEPIVTRSETFDEPPIGNSLETALATGGMKECDATA